MPTNYNKDFSSDLTSKNLLTKKLIQEILNKYIQKEECYIRDLNDIYLISYYLFHSKHLANFIKLNQLQVRDFIYLISSAKIISDIDQTVIFKEGESPLGFYIMIKGSIKAKISKFSLPDKIDSFFKSEILQEYNLESNNEEITWFEINKDNKKEENKSHEEIKSTFLSKYRLSSFSPFSCIYQQRHEERLQLSKRLSEISESKEINEKRKLSILMNEQADLFIYNINHDDILCFGNVNFFNDYLREEKQIHLTSAYMHNKEPYNYNDMDDPNNIMLYIHEENLKNLKKKISLLNKERIKFLINTLIPLKQISYCYKHYFISTIKLIYINIERQKELFFQNNIFYLVYYGACLEKDKKELIYDKGDFIGLNYLFLGKKSNLNDSIIVNSKGNEAILFKIDLNFLSENNQIKMLRFLSGIFAKQFFARKIYLNKVISYENKKIEEKEKYLDDKIKEYLNSHNIFKIHRTDRDNIDKLFQNNENNNIKAFNNVYINKNNISKLLSKSEEKKKDFSKNESARKKNKKYILKERNNNSNSYSPRTSRSNSDSTTTLPFLNQTQKSFNNKTQNPINSINYKKNCSAGVLSSKNINIISRNTTNNFVRLGGISSYDSINSLSQYDKFLQASKNKKKTFNNKNLLLKDFNISSNKMKKIFHILTKKK